jgi:hypothetical protein
MGLPLWPLAPQCPRQLSVPDQVHPKRHRLCGCRLAPFPCWLLVEASQSPPRGARESKRGGTESNRECGVIPNPFASSQSHP